MPAAFIINTEQKIVFSFGWDTVTFADVIDHRSRLSQDARFQPEFSQIINFTRAKAMELSGDQIARLAKQRVVAPESRRAIVAATSLHYGLSRMFQTYSDSKNIRIFQDLNEAAEWVGVPPEVAHQAFQEFSAAHDLA